MLPLILALTLAQPDHSPLAPPLAPPQNFGVDLKKLNGQPDHYRLNGKSISKDEAHQVLGSHREAGSSPQPELPLDAQKLRITIIGPDADRRRVLNDFASHPLLAVHRNQFLIQDYPPDNWAVARSDFITTGKPTIYVQTPAGNVLHRQDDYTDAGDLAKILAAVRKPAPDYDSKRDPDLRQSPLFDEIMKQIARIPTIAWIALAFAAFMFLNRNKTQTK